MKTKVAYITFAENPLWSDLCKGLKEANSDINIFYICAEGHVRDLSQGKYKVVALKTIGNMIISGFFFEYIVSIFTNKPTDAFCFFFFRNFYSTIKKIDPDVIVLNTLVWGFSYQTLWYAYLKKKKLIIQFQTQQWPKQLLNRIFLRFFVFIHKQIIFKYSSILLAWTRRGKNFWLASYGSSIKKIHLLTAGIDHKIFYPKKNRTYMRGGIVRLLILGRMVPYKNHLDLLKAIDELKNKGFNHVSLSIVGKGPLKSDIDSFIEKKNLTDCVKYLPYIPHKDLRQYYWDHDVLILPSNNEQIGMVVLEAMACGTPTITSDTVGANVYVKDGGTGLIFKTGKYKDLAEKISKIADKKILHSYGAEASTLAQEDFTSRSMGERFNKLIKLAMKTTE